MFVYVEGEAEGEQRRMGERNKGECGATPLEKKGRACVCRIVDERMWVDASWVRGTNQANNSY